jgi:hypothetical protein
MLVGWGDEELTSKILIRLSKIGYYYTMKGNGYLTVICSSKISVTVDHAAIWVKRLSFLSNLYA